MHMENMVMGIAFGTAVTVYKNARITNYKGTYTHIKLQDIIKDEITENTRPKEFPNYNNRYAEVSTDNFSKIPGSPIAYWVKEKIFNSFIDNNNAKKYADFRHGMSTSDNNRFLRLWFEVSADNIGFNAKSKSDTENKKWFKYLKGGTFRKWYGNFFYVVNWKNDGEEIKQISNIKYPYLKGNLDFVLGGQMYFFKPGCTWSSLTSGLFNLRRFEDGFIFDAKGQCFFPYEDKNTNYLLALFNSKVFMSYAEILSPTMDFNSGVISKVPILYKEDRTTEVDNLSEKSIALCRNDWDSFETSWDFKKHPLV